MLLITLKTFVQFTLEHYVLNDIHYKMFTASCEIIYAVIVWHNVSGTAASLFLPLEAS